MSKLIVYPLTGHLLKSQNPKKQTKSPKNPNPSRNKMTNPQKKPHKRTLTKAPSKRGGVKRPKQHRLQYRCQWTLGGISVVKLAFFLILIGLLENIYIYIFNPMTA